MACALYGRAPYRGLLTHGFTVDSQGRKMSKSHGQRHRAAEGQPDAGRRDHPPVGGGQRLLGRHRRRRQDPGPRRRRLPAHPQHAALPARQHPRLRSADRCRAGRPRLLEIDRWALARAAELQAEILAHYEVYEFHPVVAKLQVFCSEDLGAFYLDVLKDRLYTTAPKSLARRSAQTALWQITQAMLRWMAPFLSFTAEEAWTVLGRQRFDLHRDLLELRRAATPRCWPNGRACARSATSPTRRSRPCAQPVRVGSSLQANLAIGAPPEDHAAAGSRWATT